jgi:hypothetical protein
VDRGALDAALVAVLFGISCLTPDGVFLRSLTCNLKSRTLIIGFHLYDGAQAREISFVSFAWPR